MPLYADFVCFGQYEYFFATREISITEILLYVGFHEMINIQMPIRKDLLTSQTARLTSKKNERMNNLKAVSSLKDLKYSRERKSNVLHKESPDATQSVTCAKQESAQREIGSVMHWASMRQRNQRKGY